MKVLIYAHNFAPSVGGVEMIARELAVGLARLNRGNNLALTSFDVTLLTETAAAGLDDSKWCFRIVRHPKFSTWLREISKADTIELEGPALLPQFLSWIMRKRLVIRHHGYQAVCPNGLMIVQSDRSVCPGHFLARRYGRCINCNAANSSRFASLRNLILTFPRRWFARQALVNICVSRYLAKILALPYTMTISNGVPVPPEPYRREGISSPPRFAFVGRLVHEKGVEVLLRAASHLASEGREFLIDIIGDGPERSRLEILTEELLLRDRVRFLGSMRDAGLEAALQGILAAVMPSLWAETFGLAAVEQMMRGRALVVSDIGALSEVVGNAALKFPPGDVGSLAACLGRLLDDPTLSAVLGQAGRQRVEVQFSNEQMIAQTARLYESLLQIQ